MKKTMPQVLLLGNGINRAYGDKSWQDLIRALKTNEKISLDDEEIKKIPYPLQVILAARGNVNVRESNGLSSICGRENIDDMQPVLQKLYAIGFDDVLTANYSYELERSIQPKVKPDGMEMVSLDSSATQRPDTLTSDTLVPVSPTETREGRNGIQNTGMSSNRRTQAKNRRDKTRVEEDEKVVEDTGLGFNLTPISTIKDKIAEEQKPDNVSSPKIDSTKTE